MQDGPSTPLWTAGLKGIPRRIEAAETVSSAPSEYEGAPWRGVAYSGRDGLMVEVLEAGGPAAPVLGCRETPERLLYFLGRNSRTHILLTGDRGAAPGRTGSSTGGTPIAAWSRPISLSPSGAGPQMNRASPTADRRKRASSSHRRGRGTGENPRRRARRHAQSREPDLDIAPTGGARRGVPPRRDADAGGGRGGTAVGALGLGSALGLLGA